VAYGWARDVEAMTVAYVRGTPLRQIGALLHFDWQAWKAGRRGRLGRTVGSAARGNSHKYRACPTGTG